MSKYKEIQIMEVYLINSSQSIFIYIELYICTCIYIYKLSLHLRWGRINKEKIQYA